MKNRMMAIPVLMLALSPVACGSLSPTAPEDTTMTGGSSASVTSSSLRKPMRPAPSCPAAALVLASTAENYLRISAQYVDSAGKPSSSEGCTAIIWSVSPKGAYVQPVATGTAAAQIVDLVVMSSVETYTVTAVSSGLSASIQIVSVPPSNETPGNLKVGSAREQPNGPNTRICLAQAITLSDDPKNPFRIIARLSGSTGKPVSSAGCRIVWSVAPEGAYMQLKDALPDGQIAELIILGVNQMYTVTTTTNGLTASIDVNGKYTGRVR